MRRISRNLVDGLASAALALALSAVLAVSCAPANAAGLDVAPYDAPVVDIIKMSSGIRIYVFQKGTGALPKGASSVRVHYHGRLMDGTVFDSSFARQSPVQFSLAEVIPCWKIAMQQIPVGSKVRVMCPAHTAYGEHGAGGVIPPNADLQFDVELLATN